MYITHQNIKDVNVSLTFIHDVKHVIVVLYVPNYLQIDCTCLKWSIRFGPSTLVPSMNCPPHDGNNEISNGMIHLPT
jgi:hypothetical protein